MTSHPFLVIYDPDAVLELEELSSRQERKATFTVVDKLRRLGERLPPPHMKPLQGEPGLLELRPRQGNSPVRPIYARLEQGFVILAFSTKPDKAGFARAVIAAHRRLRQYRP